MAEQAAPKREQDRQPAGVSGPHSVADYRSVVSDAQVHELGTLRRDELIGQNRRSVLDAIDKRIEGLTEPGQPTWSADELIDMARQRWQTDPAIVQAALAHLGVDRLPVEVADQLVPQFRDMEVRG